MIVRDTLLKALGEFYKIEPSVRNLKTIEERYRAQRTNLRQLDLDDLLTLLGSASTSDKHLRLSLDAVMWPIEMRRNRGESIPEHLLLFSEIMGKEIYQVDDVPAEQVMTKKASP